MSIARAFTFGLLAAFAVVSILYASDRLPGEVVATLVALPVAALTAAGMFEGGPAGWPWRFARGVVGAVLAGVAGFATLWWLLDATRWFRIGDPVAALILIGLAAACGWIAAAATRPSRGFALAGGFNVGFVVVMIPALIIEHGRDLGVMAGFAIILGAGALVGALLGTAAR